TRHDLQAGLISWRAMTPVEHGPLDDKALEELRQQGKCKPFEKEYIRKDGNRVPILVGGMVLQGQPDHGIAFVLDLTDRKNTERALQDRERRLQAIVGTTPECIKQVSHDGTLLEMNPAGLKMIEADSAEA